MIKLPKFLILLTSLFIFFSLAPVFSQSLPHPTLIHQSNSLNHQSNYLTSDNALVAQDLPTLNNRTSRVLKRSLNNVVENKNNKSTPDLDAILPIKNSPVKEIFLPGLMRIPGSSAQMIDPTRGQIVEFVSGGSSSVYASNTDINLIQLPFKHPLITSTDELDIKQSDSNIYFQFKIGSTKPVQLFVENQSESNNVISLQLIPKSIVSQVIKILDNSLSNSSLNTKLKSSDYASQLVETMELVANNQSPQGFSKISLNYIPPIIMNGLVIFPLQRMSNSDQEIYVYEARNPSQNVVALAEKEFEGEAVLSVSIFPTPILNPGERTKIFVIARKQSSISSSL